MTEVFVTNEEETRRGCLPRQLENSTENFSPSRIPFNIQPVSPTKTPEKELETSRELKASSKKKSK